MDSWDSHLKLFAEVLNLPENGQEFFTWINRVQRIKRKQRIVEIRLISCILKINSGIGS